MRHRHPPTERTVPVLKTGDEYSPQSPSVHLFHAEPEEPKVIITRPEAVAPGLRLGDWSQVAK